MSCRGEYARRRLSWAVWASVVAISWANVAAQAQEAPPAEAAPEQPVTAAEPPTRRFLRRRLFFRSSSTFWLPRSRFI